MMRILILATFFLVPASGLLNAADPITLPLWPLGTPGPMPEISAETRKRIESYGGITTPRLSFIHEPTITVYRPVNPNGTAVIVAPGGGFMFLSASFEGTDVCHWLNSLGVTAVLLKYRTPTRDGVPPYELPVQDAQRAMGLVRHHASEWNINPAKVGLLGFSAGANLAGHAAWENDQRTYLQDPRYDDPRGPDFLVFIYGGGFTNPVDPGQLKPDFKLPENAPPAFFLVSHDDKNNPVEAAQLYLAYQRQKLPTELHIFTKGGHGYGIRKTEHPVAGWPRLCGEWMASLKLIPATP